jgi:hypothetical protein
MAAVPIASGAASDRIKNQIKRLSRKSRKLGIPALDWDSKVRKLHMQGADPHEVTANILCRDPQLGSVDPKASPAGEKGMAHEYTLEEVRTLVDDFRDDLASDRTTGTSHAFAIGMHQGTFCSAKTARQTRADFIKASSRYVQMFGMPAPNCWKELRVEPGAMSCAPIFVM